MVEAAGRRIDAPRLRTLRGAFGGDVILPEDEAYDEARAVWNGMIDRRPAIVVRPLNATDVIAALRFARHEDLIVAVRSGGHSLAGLSTCDDGILVDLARMRGVTVDPDRRLARCTGGALLGELDDAAQAFGLACNVGTVSHTGVAGLTLGGGMGRLQRKLGLTIDCLRAVELHRVRPDDARRLLRSEPTFASVNVNQGDPRAWAGQMLDHLERRATLLSAQLDRYSPE